MYQNGQNLPDSIPHKGVGFAPPSPPPEARDCIARAVHFDTFFVVQTASTFCTIICTTNGRTRGDVQNRGVGMDDNGGVRGGEAPPRQSDSDVLKC